MSFARLAAYPSFAVAEDGSRTRLDCHAILAEGPRGADLTIDLVPEAESVRSVMFWTEDGDLSLEPVAANLLCLKVSAGLNSRKDGTSRRRRGPERRQIFALHARRRRRALRVNAIAVELPRRLELLIDFAPMPPWQEFIMVQSLGAPLTIDIHSGTHVLLSCNALFRDPDAFVEAQRRDIASRGPHVKFR